MSCTCGTKNVESAVHTESCSQVALKCPWQWREPFLRQRKLKYKRKAPGAVTADPVDPCYTDLLQPGSTIKQKKDVETKEIQDIETEILRLRQLRDQHATWDVDDSPSSSRALENWIKEEDDEEPSVDGVVLLSAELASAMRTADEAKRQSKRLKGSRAALVSEHSEHQRDGTVQLLSDHYDMSYCGEDDFVGSETTEEDLQELKNEFEELPPQEVLSSPHLSPEKEGPKMAPVTRISSRLRRKHLNLVVDSYPSSPKIFPARFNAGTVSIGSM